MANVVFDLNGFEITMEDAQLLGNIIDTVGAENKIKCIKIIRGILSWANRESGLKYCKDLFEIYVDNKSFIMQRMAEISKAKEMEESYKKLVTAARNIAKLRNVVWNLNYNYKNITFDGVKIREKDDLLFQELEKAISLVENSIN